MALSNFHQRLKLAKFEPESGFALKYIAKFRTISDDSRITLTNAMTEGVLSDKPEWDKIAYVEGKLESYGKAQENAAAAAYRAAPRERVRVADEDRAKPNRPGGPGSGLKRKIQKPSQKGKGKGKGKGTGKGKGAGKGAGTAEGRAGYAGNSGKAGKGGGSGKPAASTPPPRPPASWSEKNDWRCALCKAFNYEVTRDGAKNNTCFWCKRQKHPLTNKNAAMFAMPQPHPDQTPPDKPENPPTLPDRKNTKFVEDDPQ